MADLAIAPADGTAVAPADETADGRHAARRRARLIGRYVVMVACAAVMIGPFVWMVLAALKTDADIRSVPPTLIPTRSPARTSPA